MKKQVLFSGLIWLSFMGLQTPALADYDWFKKYDQNNDARWDRAEFERAQRDWELHHHGHPMSDKELRKYYARLDRDQDGYLAAEEARHAHHW